MPIITIPPEIFLQITTHLPHSDLTKLVQVCKYVQTLVEPVLWREIELHREYFHEDVDLAFDQCKPRPYRHGMSDETVDMDSYTDDKCAKAAQLFLVKFDNLGKASHLEQLASHVRWLCLEVKPYQCFDAEGNQSSCWNVCWNAFTKFPNLEYLEIHARYTRFESVVFDPSASPLKELHTVKLRGYIPKEFIEYLLQRPSSIKKLELAVLDDPIGDSCSTPRINPPRSELYESPSHDVYAPRPLIFFPGKGIPHFKSLTHLWLCKPTDGYDRANPRHGLDRIYYSEASDKSSFEEWAKILTAIKDTLTHLTLEHRPTTDENEMDGTENDEYMRGRREHESAGKSYQRFCSTVLPVLLDTKCLSPLKEITLFGIECASPTCVNCERMWNYEGCDGAEPACSFCAEMGLECTPIEPKADCIKLQLEARYPNVDVKSLLGRRMLFDTVFGHPCSGHGVLGDGIQEDEDGMIIR
ncbi:hypothetical protein HYALB_00004831 [Hymenoscyphus albidus]|uniref:F-box domain-containing protein n=1 Tax=Hymenoscyphus albidus TaxID=595503 RepID=A0A9N9LW34_9HELO|nr:hypothetical protein HYALB_00004831 [Hymenoscyphus albidus]